MTGLKVTGKDNIFVNCGVEGFDKGIELGETAKGNKFFNTDVIAPSQPLPQPRKKWYERPFGIVLLGVVATLIGAAIWYYFSLPPSSPIKPLP